MTGDIGRRVKAARCLAGLSTPQALAASIDERGLGAATLRAIEAGRRDPRPSEVYAIATACGLPLGFFSKPLSELGVNLADEVAENQHRILKGSREEAAVLRRALDDLRGGAA